MTDARERGGEHAPTVRLGTQRAWARATGAAATGRAIKGGALLRDHDLATLLAQTPTESLAREVSDLRGNFAAIVERADATYAIVDQIRSVPLFCVSTADGRVVTDDPLAFCQRPITTDWQVQAEFLGVLCVSGTSTLAPDVEAAQAGSIMRVPAAIGDRVTYDDWYTFTPNLCRTAPDDLVDGAVGALEAAIDHTIQIAEGGLIAVPLSGGLDSGIIAALLAGSDVERERILTYTFGLPSSGDCQQSKRVAETFGLRWEYVEYTPAMWQQLPKEPWWPDYLRWASSLTGSPGFVDLLAVRELRRRGVLPEGSTIVPGHTGDFVSGSWIPGRLWKKSRGTRADVVDAVLDTYYKYRDPHLIATLLSREEADIATALRDRASASLAPSSDSLEREELVSLSEQWGWRQRQAKFIANGVRIYDRHGMRWSLPWWDRDVLDYWCRVPLEMRIAQRLRSMIADRVGWPTKALPSSHRLERTVQTIVRRTGFDGAAKRLLFRWRRASAGMQYRHDPLGSYALFGDHVATEYRGTQTPRALLAPDVLAALARA